MQLIRGESLCVALYHALAHLRHEDTLVLGRIGSHSAECHFGIVRTMLRGDDRFDRWMSAEAKAVMVERLISQLGYEPMTRRSRVPISGARVSGWEMETTFDGQRALAAALVLASGDNSDVEFLLEVLEGPLTDVHSPLARQGEASGARHVTRCRGIP
jgi:hypothetical protein